MWFNSAMRAFCSEMSGVGYPDITDSAEVQSLIMFWMWCQYTLIHDRLQEYGTPNVLHDWWPCRAQSECRNKMCRIVKGQVSLWWLLPNDNFTLSSKFCSARPRQQRAQKGLPSVTHSPSDRPHSHHPGNAEGPCHLVNLYHGQPHSDHTAVPLLAFGNRQFWNWLINMDYLE